MSLFEAASSVYGQLRGYGRRDIRRAVAASVTRLPEALQRDARALFDRRVRRALADFPGYAEKVDPDGALLRSGDPIRPSAVRIWTREDQKALFERGDNPVMPGSFVHSTGGSTGVPLKFRVSRESYEWRSAVSDRGYSWARAEEGRRSFYVWGTPIYPPAWSKRAKLRLHHWLQRRTYFDSFEFDDTQKRACCEAINRVRPESLVGYAGNLVELACFVRDNPGVLRWRSPCGVTAAEGLHPGQRELLQATLVEKVFMSYGSREFMLIGMECREHSGYHVSSDSLLVEVVDTSGSALPPGESGRIVITDLRNLANPFIRYAIGDLGAMGDPDAACPCGLPLPVLASVDGRSQEVIEAGDGTRLTALFVPHLMKEFEWVDGYQVVQTKPGRMVMHLVTTGDLSEERVSPIATALRAKLGGDMQIGFERVDALSRSRSGKIPIVVRESAV